MRRKETQGECVKGAKTERKNIWGIWIMEVWTLGQGDLGSRTGRQTLGHGKKTGTGRPKV